MEYIPYDVFGYCVVLLKGQCVKIVTNRIRYTVPLIVVTNDMFFPNGKTSNQVLAKTAEIIPGMLFKKNVFFYDIIK
jgi:hypothetical protein